MESDENLYGVIEGFYGAPWPQEGRLELLARMPGWGLNTYMYGPKDDLKHRALWRELYSGAESEELGELIAGCQRNSVRFIYALSPGLDIRYSDPQELVVLRKKLEQLRALGCRDFTLLFDDIPDQLRDEDVSRRGSLARAQCEIANAMWGWAQETEKGCRFLFCPTAYCGRMAERGLGGPNYLEELGAGLADGIDLFWTGPEIISREISVKHLRDVQKVLRRKPVLWDNLHANDYDGRRFYCGPYSGRALDVRSEVRGVLANPNNELPLNFVPLRTLGAYAKAEGAYDARAEYLAAVREWHGLFELVGDPVAVDDLALLGDFYYLPHKGGPLAQSFLQSLEHLLAQPPDAWGDDAKKFFEMSGRLRRVCARLPELKRRTLFHALSRRAWELREELELLEGFIRHRAAHSDGTAFRSDGHLPGTYRGGSVARLQSLLRQLPDGSFVSEVLNWKGP